ncbi:MAG TPA: group II truncated hemoglobin [Dehalococcoidia bacterium]|nr:group II truncated hemoglobin [Dehalococcoidia bacterium]
MAEATTVPTLFEWAGGLPAFEKLTAIFYAKVPHDSLLAPVFGAISPEHANRVGHFIAEVFGGPPLYTQARGGHATMIHEHLNRRLSEAQRQRCFDLLCQSANEAGFPADPEFRSAFVAYLEWGTRIAAITSQQGGDESPDTPMPRWGWGVPGGPYRP